MVRLLGINRESAHRGMAKSRGTSMRGFSDSVWSPKTIISLVVILAGLSLTMFGVFRLKQSQISSLPSEFEGRIVEKWVSTHETQQGSDFSFFVLVEIEGTRRLTVPLDRDTYERAQIGMRLRRSQRGLELVSQTSSSSNTQHERSCCFQQRWTRM